MWHIWMDNATITHGLRVADGIGVKTGANRARGEGYPQFWDGGGEVKKSDFALRVKIALGKDAPYRFPVKRNKTLKVRVLIAF